MARNEIMQAVKDLIRQPFAFPGGYRKTLIMADNECLCGACVKENYRFISDSTRNTMRDGWQAHAVIVHWEGAPLVCAHCNKEIESEYGEPEE